MEKVIVVAKAENNAIGRGGNLLWHISGDLKHFKKVTMGGAVIMGRKTFDSIGFPLPGRLNIVISGTVSTEELSRRFPKGAIKVAGSLDEAFRVAEESGTERCFVIGGGQIYAQAIDLVDRMVVSEVPGIFEDADTFFPKIDPEKWENGDPEANDGFSVVEYTRKSERPVS